MIESVQETLTEKYDLVHKALSAYLWKSEVVRCMTELEFAFRGASAHILIETSDKKILETLEEDLRNQYSFVKPTEIAKKMYPDAHVNSFGDLVIKK